MLSVWSVAMTLRDNQPHGCLRWLVTAFNRQKNNKKKEKQDVTTYLCVIDFKRCQVERVLNRHAKKNIRSQTGLRCMKHQHLLFIDSRKKPLR